MSSSDYYSILSLPLRMVLVGRGIPVPLRSAGHMGPSSVSILFAFISSDDLAALLLRSAARGGNGESIDLTDGVE
jgi:hypothetical protein